MDGEHSGQSVINDLEIADHLLSDRGMAVFDDFFHRAIHKSPKQFSSFSRRSPGTWHSCHADLTRDTSVGRKLRVNTYSLCAHRCVPIWPNAGVTR